MPAWVWAIIDGGILVIGGLWWAFLAIRVARRAQRIKRITQPMVDAAEALSEASSQGK